MKPNQVWATDISDIPMAKGFVYLVAIVDGFSRKVLSHRISITLEADFCVEALEEVYLHAYAYVSEARNSIGRYLGFHNARRPHSSLGGRTPGQTCFDNLPQAVAACIGRDLRSVTPAGRRPTSMTPRRRQLEQPNRRRSTYQTSKAGQTNRATSVTSSKPTLIKWAQLLKPVFRTLSFSALSSSESSTVTLLTPRSNGPKAA